MTSPAQSPESGGLVLDVSLSCAWCFADEASDAGWAILSGRVPWSGVNPEACDLIAAL
jgi:hypothetical protein